MPDDTVPLPPELEAELVARKQRLDRQTVMAAVGLFAVALFMVFDANDPSRTMTGMVKMLPWLIGLTIAIYLLNRWTFSIQARFMKLRAREAKDA